MPTENDTIEMLVSQMYQLSAQIVELKCDREQQLSMQSQLCRPILDSRPIKRSVQYVTKADRHNGNTFDRPMPLSSYLYNDRTKEVIDSTETILSCKTMNQVGIEKVGLNSSKIKLLKCRPTEAGRLTGSKHRPNETSATRHHSIVEGDTVIQQSRQNVLCVNLL